MTWFDVLTFYHFPQSPKYFLNSYSFACYCFLNCAMMTQGQAAFWVLQQGGAIATCKSINIHWRLTWNWSIHIKARYISHLISSLFQQRHLCAGTFPQAQWTTLYSEWKFFYHKQSKPSPSWTQAARLQGQQQAADELTTAFWWFQMLSSQHGKKAHK